MPSWHVVEALVEVLGTKHPQATPEEILPRFYDLWQRAIDEESEAPDRRISCAAQRSARPAGVVQVGASIGV
ncbi:hypothetical protein [Actinacidiphila oryziradicis]|uniref:Uncharacterized protein n=1 Tax=Actinacidiphila oryziradicis TaxID=2571141 RepID=A0A4U0RVM1_9ACTN|nr:hypothetical protein [Actinacidiphila oryziradicis]TJZ99597.1 hypothetical protein FCI23_45120 [Actinacidiphila oryziradicis]